MSDTVASEISCIVLAAGASKRFGPENKLMAPFRRGRVIDRALEIASVFPWAKALAVHREDDQAVKAHIEGAHLKAVPNPNPENGMASSIGAGVQALAEAKAQRILILPADLPCLELSDMTHLLKAARVYTDPYDILRLSFRGKPGHPVLFGTAFFDQLTALSVGEGARSIFGSGTLRILDRPTDGCTLDVDTAEALEGARKRKSSTQGFKP